MNQKKESESSGKAQSLDVEYIVVADSLRAPESHVDDCFVELDDLGNKPVEQKITGNLLNFNGANHRHTKEDNDWFLDTNLDELEALGSTSMATNGALDVLLNQGYLF